MIYIIKLTIIGFLIAMGFTIVTLGFFGFVDYIVSLIKEWPEEDQ